MNLIRLFAGAAGESDFEQCDLQLTLKRIRPTRGSVSHFRASGSKSILAAPAPRRMGRVMHVSPKRQIMFCLSGSIKVTSSLKDERLIKAGMGLLMEDTTGNGDLGEVISSVPVTEIIIQQE